MKNSLPSQAVISVFCAIMVCLSFSLNIFAESPAPQARNILKTTGIQGGLIVHLGCGDGKLTAALRFNERYVVHGLEPDTTNVDQARKYIQSLGIYGEVSVDRFDGKRLPYTDNLVNLVVSENPGLVSMREIMRVLAPRGVAYIKNGDIWNKTIKPVPQEIDEWTHFLHGPNNNAVANDTQVGPPHHVQWIAEPRWARGHESLATVSGAVSANGRIFSIIDEGPIASVTLPAQWFLVARDAFNGMLLWKRPIHSWEGQLRGFRSGPAELPRRLVAINDQVYVTLGYGEPVTALDAATGETVKTYTDTEDAHEILYDRGILYLVIGDVDKQKTAEAAQQMGPSPPPRNKRLLVIDAKTGKVLWKKADPDTSQILPTTIAVHNSRVYFHSTHDVICLDAKSGQERWRSPQPVAMQRLAWSVPTLVVYKDVVLIADRNAPDKQKQDDSLSKPLQWKVSIQGGGKPGELLALSAETGRQLWSAPCFQGYNAPVDIFVVDDLVWTGSAIKAKDPGFTQARDVKTGEVKLERPRDQEFFIAGMSHHRCYRNKATNQYLLLGRAGVEFIDLASGRGIENHWVRGTCQYGVLPCNGLLYAPPHTCACFLDAKLDSFNALAAKRKTTISDSLETRLVQGPAYEQVQAKKVTFESKKCDWPTFRHDPSRSGCSPCAIDTKLKVKWQVDLHGKLSSPVCAEGKVFVAEVDAHTVHAVDAENGNKVWSYTTGGRVDSPPTIYQGKALFGSADGWIYCLRAADGKLAWRFRAAPEERRVMVYDQLESAWPVHGSVLVDNDVIYCTAGRSSYLDGGIYLYRLDVNSGKLISQTSLDYRDPKTDEQPDDVVQGFGMKGALSDVLSLQDDFIYMRHVKFDRQGIRRDDTGLHLFCPTGFLDDTWWHRSYWMWGTHYISGWGGWWRIGNLIPSGRVLVMNDSFLYGFGRNFYPGGNAGQWNKNEFYHFFAAPKNSSPLKLPTSRKQRIPGINDGSAIKYQWTKRIPYEIRAMVLTDQILFAAGPKGNTHVSQDAFEGKQGIVLKAVSTQNGQELAEYKLHSLPVFDGLIAANGRLYVTTLAGEVLCLSDAQG